MTSKPKRPKAPLALPAGQRGSIIGPPANNRAVQMTLLPPGILEEKAEDDDDTSSSESSAEDSGTSSEESSSFADEVEEYEEDYYSFEEELDRVLNSDYPPPPPPNFTYRLKIAVTFLQIVTNIGSNLEIQWPESYKTFVLYFDIANFDFIAASGFDCVGTFGYYRRFLLVASVPIMFMVVLFLLYLLPEQLRNNNRTVKDRQRLFRYRTNYWRMFLYTLFLIYPGVSTSILGHYVCKDVYGTSYLQSDFRETCDTDAWRLYSYGSISLIVLYPIGIPLFFWILLRINKDHLHSADVNAQLGFLYAGYKDDVWWFEVADCFHKLFLTSCLAFLPRSVQLPVGEAVCVLYLIVILVLNPYLRRGDDLLHLFAQVEIFLLIMAGDVVYNLDVVELNAKDDIVLSACLIAATVMFMGMFVGQGLFFLRNTWREWMEERKENRRNKDDIEELERVSVSKHGDEIDHFDTAGATASKPVADLESGPVVNASKMSLPAMDEIVPPSPKPPMFIEMTSPSTKHP